MLSTYQELVAKRSQLIITLEVPSSNHSPNNYSLELEGPSVLWACWSLSHKVEYEVCAVEQEGYFHSIGTFLQTGTRLYLCIL